MSDSARAEYEAVRDSVPAWAADGRRLYDAADAALAESDKRIAELEGEVERLRAELKLANDCICERTAQRNEAEAALLARRAEEGGSDG